MSTTLPIEEHGDIGGRAIEQYRKWRRSVMSEGTGEEEASSLHDGQAEPGDPGSAASR